MGYTRSGSIGGTSAPVTFFKAASAPSSSDLFAGVTSKAERNARAIAAVDDYGCAIREVATFLGCHYATVSRVVSGTSGRNSAHKMSYFKT